MYDSLFLYSIVQIMESSMNHMLELWSQAGDRPYEVLIKEGLYDQFLEILNSLSYHIEDKLYRGLYQCSEIRIDNEYPTSWSLDMETALNFTNREVGSTVLCLSSDHSICAIESDNDYYQENEVVIAPINLRIVNVTELRGIQVIEVVPT